MLKKLLILIPSLAGVGGTERMVDGLSRLLAGRFEVVLASFDPPGSKPHFSTALPFYTLGPIRRWPLALRWIAYAMAARRLRRLKRRLGTQVTISNLWGADLISVLSAGPDRKLCIAHTSVLDNASNAMMMRWLPVVAPIYRAADRVIAVSAPLASELKRLYRLDDARISHINNFMNRPPAISFWPISSLQRYVWCGRAVNEKNLDGLLHLWSNFAANRTDVQLVLLGDGPLLASEEIRARAMGLSISHSLDDTDAQVVFAGVVSNPADFLVGARAMLLPSRAEGLPMVLLEALSLGVPVLVADCPSGGVRSALAEGDGQRERADGQCTSGWLLPVPEPLDASTFPLWYDALTLLAEDDALHLALAAGALQRARLFSSEQVEARWTEEIERLVGAA